MNVSPESRIAELYSSPLADFIRTRDALARELRSAGDREGASAIKSLRKPSRLAWALNRVANQAPQSVSALEAAVADIASAHGGKGDVRTAMAALRSAVREYATVAAEECRDAGFSLGIGDLSNAILAVLGSPGSYAEFRSGRLEDVPAAGGLDFLTSLPTGPKLAVSGTSRSAASHVDPAEAAAVRKQARRAAEALEAARAAAESAAAALSEAESELAAAQDRMRLAESEMKAAQQRREFARRAKEAKSVELREAEAVCQEAERRLEGVHQ
jgi:hypothetical protein